MVEAIGDGCGCCGCANALGDNEDGLTLVVGMAVAAEEEVGGGVGVVDEGEVGAVGVVRGEGVPRGGDDEDGTLLLLSS